MESVLMISPDMSVIHLITYLHPARDKLLDKLIERLYQQDARQTILVRFDAWEMRVAIPDKHEEGNRTGKELLWQYFFYPKISGSFIANSTNQVVTNIVSLRCPTQGSPATPAAGHIAGSWMSHLGGLQRSPPGHWEPWHYSPASIQWVCHGGGSWI